MELDSNAVERAAEAACQAWLRTDLSAALPDRTPADYPLDSQEWSDFWQGLGIARRNTFRAEARAVLRSASEPMPGTTELSPLALLAIPEITAWLEKTAPGLRYKTARDGLAVACALLKREITEPDDEDEGS